jgi:hypothetical protein
MTNKGKATGCQQPFRLPTVRLVTLTIVVLALALATTACKDDKTPDPECDCTVKAHNAPCECDAAGTPACDCTEEQPKAQHSPNVPMFADCTAAITTDDTFTDTQWNAIVSAIVGKFSAAYDVASDNRKNSYASAFESGITIIVEKNPTGYTNYKVTQDGKTLYVRADGVNNLDPVQFILAWNNGVASIDGVQQ